MKPSHSRRTNDTTNGHAWRVPLGALLRRVVVLSTARPASHRGIPSLPVPGRRRAPGISFFPIVLATILVAILVFPALAAPELRWIAFVRTEPSSEFRGSAEVVRSDGRGRRTLIEEGVFAIDLGALDQVYAARDEPVRLDSGSANSVILTSITDGSLARLFEAAAGSFYSGVAASSDGKVAVNRVVTKMPFPSFLAGIQVLRSTSVPILVPPEMPPGTLALVPTGEKDSYQLLFTNDPEGALAHVDQINVLVSGAAGPPETMSDSQSMQVAVRGSNGQFFCGASTCFLTWEEPPATYTVGEFGSLGEAQAFAESLVPIDSVADPRWRQSDGQPFAIPQLLVRDGHRNERILESGRGICRCSFRPLDWSPENDRIVVLARADEDTALDEYRVDGSAKPRRLAQGTAHLKRRKVLRDAAYGPTGVVALFAEAGGLGPLQTLSGDMLASSVRAFDIEGSTLAYVNESREVIVRDLETGIEQTVGEGAIDVSVAPDLISRAAGEGVGEVQLQIEDEGLSVLQLIAIVLAGLAVLGGGALWLFVVRRRCLD